MFSNVLTWRNDPALRFEWDRLHARRRFPTGVFPVWGGIFLYVLTITYAWTYSSLLSSPPLGASVDAILIRKWTSPIFWFHGGVFWLLPWLMFERRLLYRYNSPTDLEQKTGVLLRLFTYALLAFPLIRLGVFGISQIFVRNAPCPTLVDFVLFDTRIPVMMRYFQSLTITLCFALYTLSMIVLRLRLAQWAALRAATRTWRFVFYTISTLAFAGLFFLLKVNVYDYIVPFEIPSNGFFHLFLRHFVLWIALFITAHLFMAHLIHRANRSLAARLTSQDA